MKLKSMLFALLFLCIAAPALFFSCATANGSGSATAAQQTGAATPASAMVKKTVTIILSEPNFAINGAYHELEEGLLTKAIVGNGVVMAPLADIITSLGGSYSWESASGKIRIVMVNKAVELTVGSTEATTVGPAEKTPEIESAVARKTADAAPMVRDGSLFLPVKFVMENLGCTYSYDVGKDMVSIVAVLPVSPATADLLRGGPFTFSTLLSKPAATYATPEAIAVADNILAFQNSDGGWIKLEPNIDMRQPVTGFGSLNVGMHSTIDNDSTFVEMKYLALVYNAVKVEKYRDGFYRGLSYVLSGQYQSGGWPQFFPGGRGYQLRITYNDDAMSNILNMLRDVSQKKGMFSFVDDARATQCRQAFEKGIQCILRTQVAVAGGKAAWCAQHDEKTLAPAQGRAYELPSLSGRESVGVVKFLMSIENPAPEVIDAVQSAVAWFDKARIEGIAVVARPNPAFENKMDRAVVADPSAPFLWARFYEINTNKPIFSSRDGIARYNMSEISFERRNNYSWYTNAPLDLLKRIYPEWQKKWAPEKNVLTGKY